MKEFGTILLAVFTILNLQSQSIQFDNLQRIARVSYPDSTTIEYCYDELGNRTCEIITSDSISQPDIFIADLDVSADDLCQSATFEISVSQDNLGNLATGSFTYEVRLSTDTVYDNTDELLLSQYLQSIDPAGSVEINETLELPDDLPGGEYYIIVKADPENTVNELSEENNIDFLGITVSENNGFSLVSSIVSDTCEQSIGIATVEVIDGFPPYTFAWGITPMQTESSAINLIGGIYTVTVIDGMGCQEVETVIVSNIGSQPTPSFAFSVVGLDVIFENTTPAGDSYVWDFGDGANATIESPTHEYNSQGIYEVCLSVLNTCGSNQHCLEVGVGSGCDIPENLIIKSTTGTSVNLKWDRNPMAISYSLVYRLQDNIIWSSEILVDTNETTLSGLIPESMYEIKVKANCGFGSSDFSTIIRGRTSIHYLINYSEFMFQYEEICGYCGPYTKAIDFLLLNNKIVLTSTCGYGNNTEYMVASIDFNGNVLWSWRHQFLDNVDLIDIDDMSDGSIIICSKTGNNVIMSRISEAGSLVWTKKVNQTVSHAGNNIGFEISNDDFIYLTYYQRYEGEAYYYLSKYTSEGELIFSKRIMESGSTHPYRMRNIITDTLGNIIVLGGLGQPSGYEWLINKHDSLGALLWTKLIRPSSNNDFDKVEEAIFSQDGGIYIVSDDYEAGNQDMKIAKLDSSGTPLWIRNFNNVLPTGLTLYSDGIAVSGISEGAGSMFWIDTAGGIIEYPAKLALSSQINDVLVHNNKLFIIGSIIDGTDQRIALFNLDMAANEYDFLCYDTYIGDDGNISSSTILSENFSIQNTVGITDLVSSQILMDSVCLVSTLLCGIEENYLVSEFNSSDSIVCAYQPINFYFTGTGANEYLYYILNTTDTFSNKSYGEYVFPEPGEYVVCLIASNEESSDTATMSVIVHDIPDYDVQVYNSYCFIPSGYANIVNCNCIEPVLYQWSSGNNENIDTLLSPGLYSVAVIDSNGCEMITSFEIYSQPIFNIGDTSICPGEQITFNILGGELVDSLNILWSNGQYGSQITIQPTNQGMITATINTSNLFCSETVDIQMNYETCACNIVWSSMDSGIGTLRNAIECVQPGDTIHFATVLEGDTIVINSEVLNLVQDVVIQVEEDLIIVIMDNNTEFTFSVSPFAHVVIENITLLKNNENNAIYNEGTLTLKDVVLKNSSGLNGSQSLINNLGYITIVGNVEMTMSNF